MTDTQVTETDAPDAPDDTTSSQILVRYVGETWRVHVDGPRSPLGEYLTMDAALEAARDEARRRGCGMSVQHMDGTDGWHETASDART